MADFDVDKYRSSLRQKIDKAYDVYYDVQNVFSASNIGPNSRSVVFECLDDYISLLNRKLLNSFIYGEKSNVSSSDIGSL